MICPACAAIMAHITKGDAKGTEVFQCPKCEHEEPYEEDANALALEVLHEIPHNAIAAVAKMCENFTQYADDARTVRLWLLGVDQAKKRCKAKRALRKSLR